LRFSSIILAPVRGPSKFVFSFSFMLMNSSELSWPSIEKTQKLLEFPHKKTQKLHFQIFL
jgi:hypothetical protein